MLLQTNFHADNNIMKEALNGIRKYKKIYLKLLNLLQRLYLMCNHGLHIVQFNRLLTVLLTQWQVKRRKNERLHSKSKYFRRRCS